MQSLSSAEFVEMLRAAVPTVGPLLDEHVDEHGGLLIHLLLPDLLRFAAGRFADGDVYTSSRVLEVVDRALTEGDDQLLNAVAVFFVENVGAFPDETPEFVATWPPALLAEHREQQTHGS
ncbi:DUF7674 family protein [Agromyces sp. NPDC004153]